MTLIPEDQLTLDRLMFQYKRQGDLLRQLDRCVSRHASGWARHIPYRRIGNFISAKWCTGSGARDDCVIASGSAWKRDQRVIELSTFHYPSAPRDAFGLGISTLYTPIGSAWGASFSLWEGGKGIMGDGLHLRFGRYQEGQRDPDLTLHMGSRKSYEVHETSIDWSSGLTPLEELPLYLASAAALRDRGLALYAALLDKVLAAIRDKQVEAGDEGKYRNDGVPPPITLRPLTVDEETDALAEAEAHFASLSSALEQEYESIYQVLMEVFPFEACWPL